MGNVSGKVTHRFLLRTCLSIKGMRSFNSEVDSQVIPFNSNGNDFSICFLKRSLQLSVNEAAVSIPVKQKKHCDVDKSLNSTATAL